jgi:hypothetical protein
MLPQAASAQSPPECPGRADAITTSPPDFLRSGASLTYQVERESRTAVSEFTVTYSDAAGRREEVFVFPPDDLDIRVIRSAPSGRRLSLSFRWLQNAGEPDACVGEDAYPAIPIVARKARVGDPETPRLSGRFRVRYYAGERDTARWRLFPRCEIFGCRTRLQSTGGFKGIFVPREGSVYGLSSKIRAGHCTVQFLNGATRSFRIVEFTEATLRVTRTTEEGVANRLRLKRTSYLAAPADRSDLCSLAPRRTTDRATIRRIGTRT